jgi:hypothetical protein
MSKKEFHVNEFRIEDTPLSCTWLIVGAPGSGKCLGYGTKIRMFDNTVKAVQDIVNGDKVMGDDFCERNVSGVIKGNGIMYHISNDIQSFRYDQDFEPFTANAEHILCFYYIGTLDYNISFSRDTGDNELFIVDYGLKNKENDFIGIHKSKTFSTRDYTNDFGADLNVRKIIRIDQCRKAVLEFCDKVSTEQIFEQTEITVKDFLTLSEYDQSTSLLAYKMQKDDNNEKYELVMCGPVVIKEIGLGDYYGFELDHNKRFLLEDGLVTHNTSFIENMCYYLKHRYPVGRTFIGTEAGYIRFSGIMGELYTSNDYVDEEEKKHILRQRTCEMENGKQHPQNAAINIVDDIGSKVVLKSQVFEKIFKSGSQHWCQLFMLGIQYIKDAPPSIADSASYIAIGKQPDEEKRKAIFTRIGGVCGNYETFNALMNELTGDYTFMIINRRSQSQELEECITYYRTKLLPDKWKFGCKEYRDWCKARYNIDYTEEIIV